ncbi:unnamed protein product [Ilex paraguariensis]|uniref:Uncharacterized protein n=1 Tax=Ilex paraguariensis TaxID=185542 RepID=A0ABC8TDX3_9AQUA
MESDRTNTIPSDGVNDGLQKIRPLHGRTSGPTRRSTKGQWTPEEDEILRKAVQHFKGKNWKKIAECFKDRTDVQCLHRWQKVLNPELVKGPWSKEEDEIMVELVNKYGPKKWSTIAQHLPGRIGKQCRERWHNHLNPAIKKEAWTQEEELALIRAHQIYGNKWAELMKFLPGRTDNAIKNHWNSSVKKKLDSYLASGLLEQFQGLPLVSHLNQSMPSSSRVQQSSGDDSVPKDRTEAEEISECSQGSTVVGCSQSTSDMTNAVIHTREECRLIDEYSHGKDPSSSPASCSENYTPFQEVAFLTEVPCEVGSSSKFLEHNCAHDWGTSSGKDWQLNSNDLPNISSMDPGQESSGLLMPYIDGNINREGVSFPSQNSVKSASTPTRNIEMSCDKLEHTLTPEDGSCSFIYPQAGTDGCYSYGNFSKFLNISGVDGPTDLLLYQSANYHIPEAGTSASQPYYPPMPDMLGTSFSQPFPIPSPLPPDDGALIFGIDPNQFNDLSFGNHEEELHTRKHDGFIYTNDSASSQCDTGTYDMGLQEQLDQAKDSPELVPVDAFGSGLSNNVQSCLSNDENPDEPAEQHEGGALFYEPPRFPSLDIPFFSCDLIQSSSDMQQEYSPLGIRQLMMSSMNCLTPFRLWDSPSRDGSPDAVLKSAAKTFTCTPSILKKRHRDLVSPLSEKRREKKFEIDLKQESFSDLAKDFSRLEVMFDENAPPLSPSSKQTRNSGASMEDKENLSHDSEMGEREGRESPKNSENGIPGKEFDTSDLQEKMEQGTVGIHAKTKGDADTTAQTLQQPSGVLVEHNMNDLLFYSPDQFGLKLDKIMPTSARAVQNQNPRRLEAGVVSSEAPCLSVVITPSICGKKDGSHSAAAISVESASVSATLDNMAESSGNNAGVQNTSIFGETPFKRSIESPSAWKSPWFLNSFLPGPRVDTDITIEDIGYFMSPGDRSYDAIGLIKELSEHTATAFAEAQEVLGNETPETILRERCSKNKKADQENEFIPNSQPENCFLLASNSLTERRILDFSECGTPGKGTESRRHPSTLNISSPTSYLLKGCR